MMILFILTAQWRGISDADEPPPAGPGSLGIKYHAIQKELERNKTANPFHVESTVGRNGARVDIYGIISYPFDHVKKEFLVPANWCDIVLPHPNIRACTYKKKNDTWLLNIYNTSAFSKPLEDAYQSIFIYRVSELQAVYVDVALTAQEGPFKTKDHQFEFEAMPLSEGTTFIHLRYSFSYSAWTYLFMKIFGGGKVGFSIIDTDGDGNPVYVDGLRGAVERDVACYYLAILAYLETLEVPAEQGFDKRVGRWYELAALYKKQLLEMDEEEYLAGKKRDRRSQQQLQDDLNRQAS